MKINDFTKKISLAAFCLLNNINPIKADQPVHCLRDNVFGEWDFHVSQQTETLNLFQTNEICTHMRPNHIQIVSKDHQWKFQQEDVWKLTLADGYKASAKFCPGGKSCESSLISGTWSTIYDQAFRVELENGMRFITNFRYNVKPNLSENPVADGAQQFEGTKTGDYASFNSDCGQTMVGFVQQVHGNGSSMKAHKAQCFYGKQTKAFNIQKSVEEVDDAVKIDRIVEKNGATKKVEPISKAQVDGEEDVDDGPADEENVFLRLSHKRYNAHHEHVPSDENDLLIETINAMDLGWKADTCKYQKHHEKYGSHCEAALSLAQTGSSTTERTGGKKKFGEGKEFAAALAEAQKYQKKYSSASEIPDSELPENFDWRNVQGYDFTNEHRNQGHCGSCYTVSFTQIAESRLKLKYGKEMPLLSPQFLMTCNYMNEGCDGGWPFFHGYLAENGYMVTEECAPYKGKTKGDSCSNYANCEPHSKVQNTYFVGKGYGDSSEKKMMKEILRNGIVNGELQCPKVFSMYNEGIMTQDGIKKLHKKVKSSLAQTSSSSNSDKKEKPSSKVEITDKSLEDYGISWQNLNHSVVIIGWGVDPQTQQKYWIVRNSYGADWGDKGEFLVQRGTDDFGIESETTAYDPVLCSEGGC